MPPIDVVLQQETGIDWSTVAVAIASFLGVLLGSTLTAWVTHQASRRNASLVLDVEYGRIETEHRRHLRRLVADVAAVSQERSNLAFEHAARAKQNALDGWTDTQQTRFRETHHELLRTTALVKLTTADQRILEPIKDVLKTENEFREYNDQFSGPAVGNQQRLEAQALICERLDAAAAVLVQACTEVLADPPSLRR
ncbi:hypothetical protein UQW22_17905 [Isoptericola halotolerans]|uniref:hypothetical protein n=1 Tax=Isoptericola halotolerans TaxID=300560 RepID=UPI00388EC1C1